VATGLATGQLPMDCRICAKSPERRRAWGCDLEAEVTTEIDCPRCGGVGGCDLCAQTGVFRVDRCPMTWLPAGARHVVGYVLEWEQGRMPAAGGVSDQAAWMLEAYRFVGSQLSEWRESKCRTRK
jgi:hypothetical protein